MTAAVRDLHMMDSSKLYLRTRTKFWTAAPDRVPQTILTDELPRTVYALDYPHTTEGVVLISYTWGNDSTKLRGPGRVAADAEPGPVRVLNALQESGAGA